MYIDAKMIDGLVHVSKRDDKGERVISTHLPPYVYYYRDDNGKFMSIHGDKLHQKRFDSWRAFRGSLKKATKEGKLLYESDVDPINRLLEERFPTDDYPNLNISVLDIETDKDPARGWSNVSRPYAIINAITIRNKWEDATYTVAVPPPNLSFEEARELLDQEDHEDGFGGLTEDKNIFLVPDEETLLLMTLEIIERADVITGWNSSFFDLPYIIQRIRIALGGESLDKISDEDGSDEYPFKPNEVSSSYLKNLGMFGCLPRMRMVERFGKFEKTFDINGRIHLDYLELYRKFTFEELHQYTLDFILQKEIKQSKVTLEDSLDVMWRQKFRTFVAYNIQDVEGLSCLDDKMKLIDLANNMAHSAGVTLDKTLGSVAIIEQAVLRKLHKNGLIAFNKGEKTTGGTIPGAFVVKPIGGLYDWVWSIDINSLYPSVIRAINISPEVVIGQFDLSRTEAKFDELFEQYGGKVPGASAQKRKGANASAWGHFTGVLEYHAIIDEDDDLLTLEIEGSDGDVVEAPAHEWKQILRDNNWSVSGNGTVFTLDKEGIITQCMTDWYDERVVFQKKKKAAIKALETEKDPENRKKLEADKTYFDMIQMVKKIFLNSTYGAYLNAYFRFYDPRLGRSVTLTGRCITKHMIKKAVEVTTGNYDFDRDAMIYGDTDSAYCTLNKYLDDNNIIKDTEHVVAIADEMSEKVNASFPKFMDENHLIGEERGAIIQAGREVVADHGLFAHDTKKRYALHVVDNEGQRFNKDGTPYSKMKVMGMEIRRSDTPKFIQAFLEECVTMVVRDEKGYDEVSEVVTNFRENVWRKKEPWNRGSPCRVSKLTINASKINNYEELLEDGFIGMKKPTTHFSVKAANNTNKLMKIFKEQHWDVIHDGDKIEVLELLDNPWEVTSVALRAGEVYIPAWFKKLPFNNSLHEHKLVDKKLGNVIGNILDWNFEPVRDYREDVFEDEDFFGDVG